MSTTGKGQAPLLTSESAGSPPASREGRMQQDCGLERYSRSDAGFGQPRSAPLVREGAVRKDSWLPKGSEVSID